MTLTKRQFDKLLALADNQAETPERRAVLFLDALRRSAKDLTPEQREAIVSLIALGNRVQP